MFWELLQVVSGDFVWLNEMDDKVIFFVVDCMGYGVFGVLLIMVVLLDLRNCWIMWMLLILNV